MKCRLVVEVDGATHVTNEERAYDTRRDRFMERQGWRVIRFPNDDVYRHINETLDASFHQATSPLRPPSLRSADTSPAKTGEETPGLFPPALAGGRLTREARGRRGKWH